MKNFKLIFVLFIFPVMNSCTGDLKEVKKFYKNGKLENLHFIDKNHKTEGKSISYYENGHISEISYYKKNLANGPCHIYYKNGKLKFKGVYKKDFLIDTSFVYFKNGSIASLTVRSNNDEDLVEYFFNTNRKLYFKRGFIASTQEIHAWKNIKPNGKIDIKESKFISIKKNKNKLRLNIIGGKNYKDSIFINIIESFTDHEKDYKIKRRLKFANTRSVTLDLKETDYTNHKCNIFVETSFYKYSDFTYGFDYFYIQFDKDDKKVKDNVTPIL